MTQYRLHYAGSTFELRDKDEADRVMATLNATGGKDAGAVVTVNLVEGTLQLLLSRYVSIAVSVVAPEDGGPSAYEDHGLLVV